MPNTYRSLQQTDLKFTDHSLSGVSVAGVGTCITVPEWKVSFDVAQGLPFAFSMHNFLLSHLHQDHGSGIPYLISQKAMMSHPRPRFYLPKGTADKLEQILQLWQQLEGHQYNYDLIETEHEKKYELGKNIFFRNFKTKHRVNSQGYVLLKRHKKLDEKFKHLGREEIKRLVEQGRTVEKFEYLPKVAFTGDTEIEFLDLSPEIKKCETLIMEVTYYDDNKSIEAAKKWGHIHFKEVIPRIADIEAKNIVFIHMSARYSKSYARKLIDEHLPEHKNRIHLL